jgi:hypothetical protein
MKTLSSTQTFIMKVLFPVLWVSGFGLGTLALWVGAMHGQSGVPPEMKWQFLGAWIAGTTFILWGCAGLKRVRIDSKNPYVSNYRKEILVPFNMIFDVTENRWLNIHPVTIHLRSVTEFGSTLTFMPAMRFTLWGSHPVVAELKKLAGVGGG